ncbi:MAG: sugar ABC transporter permease [Tannerellaceae bacterium]|jgi:multiple sugar transport system permease protein|nr:sugar ABC transporter permease [Tannerellaceae bacterium]
MRSNSKRKSSRLLGSTYTPYLLSAPSILLISFILIVPIFYAIYLSFTDAMLLTVNNANFVGLKNYKTFLTSTSMSRVFSATISYVILGVFFTYFVGLGTALLLNMPLKGKLIFRVILILPWVIPQVVLALIWKWMLNPQYGVINYMLTSIGVIDEPISWFTNPMFAMITILLVTIWKQYPLSCLILFAGMKSIDPDLYEAASIDGAGAWKKFISITMPGLRYVTSVLLLLAIIWSFTNFVIIWILTAGGPVDRTATLSIYTYLNAFKLNKLGYGATVGVMCLIVSFIISVIYYKKILPKD